MEETQIFRNSERQGFLKAMKTSGKTLLATAGSWFLFDVTFYANGFAFRCLRFTRLFSSLVLERLVNPEEDPLNLLLSVSKLNILLAAIALPGTKWPRLTS